MTSTPRPAAIAMLLLCSGLVSQEPFLQVRTELRKRNCPKRSALLIQGQPQSAPRDARLLADALRRKVTVFVGKPDAGSATKAIAAWLGQQKNAGKHVDLVAHGAGVELALACLRGKRMDGISLFALTPETELEFPSENSIALEPSDSEGEDADDFARYIDAFHQDHYGEKLDPLLRSPEKRRSLPPIALFEFRMIASETYTGRPGAPLRPRFDMAEEVRRLDAWLDEPRNAKRIKADKTAIARFNRTTKAAGGPANWYLAWYPARAHRSPGYHRGFLPINLHERAFTEQHLRLNSLRMSRGPIGEYCFEYAFLPKHAKAYGETTGRNRNGLCAMIIRGVVRMAPKIMGRVPARGQLTGALSRDEIHAVIAAIRSNAAARERRKRKTAKAKGKAASKRDGDGKH